MKSFIYAAIAVTAYAKGRNEGGEGSGSSSTTKMSSNSTIMEPMQDLDAWERIEYV